MQRHLPGWKITGALTLEMVACLQNDTVQWFISLGANAGTQADNVLDEWGAQGGEYYKNIFRCENGSGTMGTLNGLASSPVGYPVDMAITRDASGNINQYLDGDLTNTGGSVTTPTGGGSGELRIGADEAETAADKFRGIIGSVRISNVEFTAAQIAAANKQVRGLS